MVAVNGPKIDFHQRVFSQFLDDVIAAAAARCASELHSRPLELTQLVTVLPKQLLQCHFILAQLPDAEHYGESATAKCQYILHGQPGARIDVMERGIEQPHRGEYGKDRYERAAFHSPDPEAMLLHRCHLAGKVLILVFDPRLLDKARAQCIRLVRMVHRELRRFDRVKRKADPAKALKPANSSERDQLPGLHATIYA